MLNHNGRLAIEIILLILLGEELFGWRKGFDPAGIAKALELLVHDIGGHDTIDHQLAESLQLLHAGTKGSTELGEPVVVEQLPGKINRVLWMNA